MIIINYVSNSTYSSTVGPIRTVHYSSGVRD